MRIRRKQWLWGGAIFLLLITTMLTYIVNKHSAAWPPIAFQQVHPAFPTYYPAELPQEVTLDKETVTSSENLVSYNLLLPNNKQAHITIRPVPKGVVFSDFYDRILHNKTELPSAEGQVVVGTADDRTIGSLLTDKVWLLLNSDSEDRQLVGELLTSLKKL